MTATQQVPRIVLHTRCRVLPVSENPSWRHTTVASTALKASSHTVPHVLLLQTSTRPSRLLAPPTSLISPPMQPILCTAVESTQHDMQRKAKARFLTHHNCIAIACTQIKIILYTQLTWSTYYTSIFTMYTVLIANWIGQAFKQRSLSSPTANIIQPRGLSSSSISKTTGNSQSTC